MKYFAIFISAFQPSSTQTDPTDVPMRAEEFNSKSNVFSLLQFFLFRKTIFLCLYANLQTHRISHTSFCPNKHITQRMYQHSCSYRHRMWVDPLVNCAGANQIVRRQSLLPHRFWVCSASDFCCSLSPCGFVLHCTLIHTVFSQKHLSRIPPTFQNVYRSTRLSVPAIEALIQSSN